MISFNSLGSLGLFSNQMFQYAALRGVCEYHGYDYMLPTNHEGNIFLYDCFKLSNLNEKISSWSNFPRRSPSHPNFDEDFLKNCPPQTDLFAYFATEKYFKHSEDLIRNEYTFKDCIIDEALNYFSKLFFTNDVISLHIRRNDFLNHELLRNLDLSYYKKCLECFEPFLPVLVFSDDIEWCKNQELFSSSRFKFSENNNKYVDMCLMTMCNYHIIANSSFSWWGSWLGKSKKTLAPREWYNIKYPKPAPWFPYPEDAEWRSNDICPENWILL
jgi:hypothetical protein